MTRPSALQASGGVALALAVCSALAPGAVVNGLPIGGSFEVASTQGNVELLAAPVSVKANQLESNSRLFLFRERATTVTDPVALDIASAGTFRTSLDPGSVAAGTNVISYLVHVDPNGNPDDNIIFEGGVTFSSEVLGLMVGQASLDASDGILGSPDTAYPTGNDERGAGIEPGSTDADKITLSTDRRTLTFTLEAKLLGQVRIVLEEADRDGDALLDTWEENGFDSDGDGSIDLDLPAMGADPDRKDVFVELDYMTPHAISNLEIAQVVAAFAAAPVANPNGVSGIALHVDNGPSSEMDPSTHATWGELSRQDDIDHVDELGTTVNDSYDWTAFQELKNAHFEVARWQVFHYAIAVHRLGGQAVVGKSRGVTGGASDFLVSQGAYVDGLHTDSDQGDYRANTFMHELGHNLGLHHGGSDGTNYKPNYLSVVNTAFSGLLPRSDGSAVLDYSRFVVPLDENSLDETVGFDISPGAGPSDFVTLYRCPDGTRRSAPLRAAEVDWNCDGSIAPSAVSTDVNDDDEIGELIGQTDWDKLIFDGGLIGAKDDPELPMQTLIDEPTQEEVSANAALLRACSAALATGAPNCLGVSAPVPTMGATPTSAATAEASPTAAPASSPTGSPAPSPPGVAGPRDAAGAQLSPAVLVFVGLAVLLLAVGALFVVRRRGTR